MSGIPILGPIPLLKSCGSLAARLGKTLLDGLLEIEPFQANRETCDNIIVHCNSALSVLTAWSQCTSKGSQGASGRLGQDSDSRRAIELVNKTLQSITARAESMKTKYSSGATSTRLGANTRTLKGMLTVRADASLLEAWRGELLLVFGQMTVQLAADIWYSPKPDDNVMKNVVARVQGCFESGEVSDIESWLSSIASAASDSILQSRSSINNLRAILDRSSSKSTRDSNSISEITSSDASAPPLRSYGSSLRSQSRPASEISSAYRATASGPVLLRAVISAEPRHVAAGSTSGMAAKLESSGYSGSIRGRGRPRASPQHNVAPREFSGTQTGRGGHMGSSRVTHSLHTYSQRGRGGSTVSYSSNITNRSSSRGRGNYRGRGNRGAAVESTQRASDSGQSTLNGNTTNPLELHTTSSVTPGRRAEKHMPASSTCNSQGYSGTARFPSDPPHADDRGDRSPTRRRLSLDTSVTTLVNTPRGYTCRKLPVADCYQADSQSTLSYSLPDASMTLPELVRHLMDGSHGIEHAHTIWQTFISTYPAYTTSQNVFNCLRREWDRGYATRENARIPMLKRFLHFLAQWISQLCWQPCEVRWMEQVANFFSVLSELPLGVGAKQAQIWAAKHQDWLKSIMHYMPVPMLFPSTGTMKFIVGDPSDFADQLTVLMTWTFQRIRHQELAICLTRERGSWPSAISQINRLSDQISAWAEQEIRQSERDSQDFKTVAEKLWIVARRCQTLQNFAATMAITSAFQTLRRDSRVGLAFYDAASGCPIEDDFGDLLSPTSDPWDVPYRKFIMSRKRDRSCVPNLDLEIERLKSSHSSMLRPEGDHYGVLDIPCVEPAACNALYRDLEEIICYAKGEGSSAPKDDTDKLIEIPESSQHRSKAVGYFEARLQVSADMLREEAERGERFGIAKTVRMHWPPRWKGYGAQLSGAVGLFGSESPLHSHNESTSRLE